MTKKFLLTFFSIIFIILTTFVLVKYYGLSKKSFQYNKPPAPTRQTHKIILKEEGFSPQEIEISVSDSVEFKTELGEPFWPASDLHPTHGIYPEFDPQEPIEPTSSWTFKFLKTGRWKYHDHLKPMFKGVIIVH